MNEQERWEFPLRYHATANVGQWVHQNVKPRQPIKWAEAEHRRPNHLWNCSSHLQALIATQHGSFWHSRGSRRAKDHRDKRTSVNAEAVRTGKMFDINNHCTNWGVIKIYINSRSPLCASSNSVTWRTPTIKIFMRTKSWSSTWRFLRPSISSSIVRISLSLAHRFSASLTTS